RTAQPRVLQAVIPEAGRRVDDTEVHAEVVQTLVEEAREHRRRPVEDVLTRRPPEGLLAYPTPPPLGQGHPERARDAVAGERRGRRAHAARSYSDFTYPAPRPSSSRPSVRRSTVAAAALTNAGIGANVSAR